ncbi:5,6-dimethylbenzimidazole synthase [Fodinicurvata fenggangensis]|uniref:5,6-dimethylbenzimidazole synthase n=1 Tax=Fodinicurvata fenggangensis TaxID=1121830 RepID=UPI000A483DF6|nr:5,6-dimethylbenzimidazole synthase [Fodinicurvata fenggangensis]
MPLMEFSRFRELRAENDRKAANEPRFDDGFRRKLEELLYWRRDVRHFSSVSLPQDRLEETLELACDTAPSVGNSQPWRFIKVSDPEDRHAVVRNFQVSNEEALRFQARERRQLYASMKLEGLHQAPEQLAVFCNEETKQGHGLGQATMPETRRYSVVMAIHTLWLLLRGQGIGMGWVSILDPDQLKRDLAVPETWSFVGYLCIGYPLRASPVAELEETGWQAREKPAAAIMHEHS